MGQDVHLTIIGTFLSTLLMVNGYLIKKVLDKINHIELKLAVLISRYDNNEERFKESEHEIRKMREKLISIEGEHYHLISRTNHN